MNDEDVANFISASEFLATGRSQLNTGPRSRDEAEQFIQRFQSLSCEHILSLFAVLKDQSSPTALFQCLVLLKHVLHNNGFNSNALQTQQLLIEFGAPCTNTPVKQQVFHVLSIILKFSWKTINRGIVFEAATELLKNRDMNIQKGGLLMLSNLLEQFRCTTCIQGLQFTLKEHVDHHRSMEKHMHDVGTIVLDYLNAILKTLKPTQEHVKLLLQTLSLLRQILSWEFQEGMSDGRLTAAMKHQISLPLNIFPGAKWSNLLVKCGLFGALCNLVRKLKKLDFKANSKQIRNCMIHLLSLKGSVFLDKNDRQQYFDLVTTQLCDLMREAGSVDDEVIDFCSMLSKIIRTLELEDLIRLRCVDTFLATLRDLSKALMNEIPLDPNSVNTHASEAFDICAQSWTALIYKYENDTQDIKKIRLESYTWPVFECFLQRRLQLARAEIEYGDDDTQFQFHDAAYLKEYLGDIASIARYTPAKSLQVMNGEIKKRVEGVIKANEGTSAPTEKEMGMVQEELFWLVTLLGYVLADEYSGEDPMIPSAFLKHLDDQDVACLFQSVDYLLAYTQFENMKLEKGSKDRFLSPFLGQTLMLFWARWAPTYLAVEPDLYHDPLNQQLLNFVANRRTIQSLLDELINKCWKNIFKWTEDESVTAASCEFLDWMTSTPRIQAILLQSPCVLDPIEIFTRNIPELLNVLSSESTVILFKSLCALTSAHSPSALEQVVSAIKMHINHVFGSFQEQASKKRISTENVERISRCLNMLLGVAKHQDAQLIFHLLHQNFKVLHEIMEILHTDVLVVQIFELYAVITESDMSKLKEADRKDWFSFILTTLRTWSAFNPGESNQRVGEIRSLLKLLENVMDKGLDSYSMHSATISTATVAIAGLGILVPALDETILQIPDVSVQYFQVLRDVLRSNPASITSLDSVTRKKLYQCLLNAIDHTVVSVLRNILDVFAVLAEHHAKDKEMSPFGPFLSEVIQRILQKLVLETNQSTIIDHICNVLLPFFTASHTAMEQCIKSFISSQDFPADIQQELLTLFSEMFTGIKTNSPLQRAKLRKQAKTFSVKVRSKMIF